MCSIVVAIPRAPDAQPGRARLLIQRAHFRRRVCARPAAAVEQHDAREILIVDAASVLVAAPGRLAHHLSPPEIAPQIPRGPATGALYAEKTDHAPLQLERTCILHDGHTAHDRRTRAWLYIRSLGSTKRDRLRAGGLCPRGGGLGDEFIPDARGDIAAGDAAGRAVVVIADPHPDDDAGGESDEPCVPVALARPGLSCRRAVDASRPASAVPHDRGENVAHGSPCAWVARWLQFRSGTREYGVVALARLTDGVGFDVFRVGGDGCEGARHLQQGDLARAECQAGHRRQFGLY